MKIGIDVDGVLADLVTPLIQFHNEKYGTELSVEDVKGYDLAEAWEVSDAEHRRRIDDFLQSDRVSNLEPLEDARGVIDILASKHDLYVLTARKPAIAREATERWVNERFPDSFEDVLFSEDSSSKAALCEENDITLLIDDNPDHVRACSEHDVTGVLFRQPWNEDADLPEHVPKVHGWSQVLQLVRNIEMFSSA